MWAAYTKHCTGSFSSYLSSLYRKKEQRRREKVPSYFWMRKVYPSLYLGRPHLLFPYINQTSFRNRLCILVSASNDKPWNLCYLGLPKSIQIRHGGPNDTPPLPPVFLSWTKRRRRSRSLEGKWTKSHSKTNLFTELLVT